MIMNNNKKIFKKEKVIKLHVLYFDNFYETILLIINNYE